MYAIASFVFSSAINWVSLAVFAGIAVVACAAYYRPVLEQQRIRLYMILAGITIAFRLAFAGVKTIFQYYAWLQSEISKFMLPPYQGIGVLLRYSWTHFWLNALISIGAALLFFIVLRSLHSYNARYFDTGEIELGLLMALVVGWPGFLVFAPIAFLSVVLISIIRGIFLKEAYTTLGLPFFIATAVALGFTPVIVAALKLTAFSI